MKRKIYNIKVDSKLKIIEQIKENGKIIEICNKNQERIFQELKCDKKTSSNFKKEVRKRLIRKIEKAISKSHYRIDKLYFEFKKVSLNKQKGEKSEGEITESCLVEKNIKQYYFNIKQLIDFISIIVYINELPSEFFEVKDVQFIIRQLNILGINDLIEYLNAESVSEDAKGYVVIDSWKKWA